MTQYKTLVFDWDGTLMDSEARILACMEIVIQEMDLEGRDREAMKNIIGLALPEAVRHLFPVIDDAQIRPFIDRYRHHYLSEQHVGSILFDGAIETLNDLKSQGYILAVATGKGRQGLDKALMDSELKGFFEATRCGDETFSKPHPQMLLEIMDELGVLADEVLVIGDSIYDMQMAANAGVDALAVSYGIHEASRLQEHKPQGCIDEIKGILPWLKA